MKAAPTHHEMIDVRALRVGMFVHLDLGWMAHPFPLGSFKIATAAQIATIASLGLERVRWSPDESDPEAAGSPPQLVAVGGVDVAPAAAAATDGADASDTFAGTAPVGLDASAAGGDTLSPGERSRAERVARLARQREAQQLVERQYGEAEKACRQTFDLIATQPVQAREQTEALTQALVSKMIGEQDLCIRMLVGTAGDKTSMHAMNVGIISLLMGRCFGFGAEEMLDLGTGALLHDIGKLELPQRLRHRDQNLSPSEAKVYEEHVELGLVQARRMGLSAAATSVIAQHHELADGSGFPAGLKSEAMTMAARIVALVNRFDNLCNPHLMARALTPHESLALLFAQWRSQFDTSILSAFIKMMGVYPPGSVVQLTDDRFGLVVAVNSARPLKPSVLVHDPSVPRDEALVLDLEAVPGLGIRRSLKAQQLPPKALDYLAPSQRVSYFFEPAALAA